MAKMICILQLAFNGYSVLFDDVCPKLALTKECCLTSIDHFTFGVMVYVKKYYRKCGSLCVLAL